MGAWLGRPARWLPHYEALPGGGPKRGIYPYLQPPALLAPPEMALEDMGSLPAGVCSQLRDGGCACWPSLVVGTGRARGAPGPLRLRPAPWMGAATVGAAGDGSATAEFSSPRVSYWTSGPALCWPAPTGPSGSWIEPRAPAGPLVCTGAGGGGPLLLRAAFLLSGCLTLVPGIQSGPRPTLRRCHAAAPAGPGQQLDWAVGSHWGVGSPRLWGWRPPLALL
ncbi:hypothetical protein NDU88_004053 [Pleurodeles waltl]|uniref:Uncharacterized protein n=1 Tax=Pleurodeles waltl TaxID=8319 RepID=A0AAV7T744_PLEWA|nr:hypothetical protein NDU88_004053 [Pleurodeles waltl]